jgi:hypothetical protein
LLNIFPIRTASVTFHRSLGLQTLSAEIREPISSSAVTRATIYLTALNNWGAYRTMGFVHQIM